MNRIKDLREDKDLKQTELAKAVGIDQRTLSNYETGKTNPDSISLIKLANFFNVSIDYLVGRTDFSILSKKELSSRIDGIQKELDVIRIYLNLE